MKASEQKILGIETEFDVGEFSNLTQEFITNRVSFMDYDFVIHTPLMWLDKAQTWALAARLGRLDYVRNRTLTCYNGIKGDGCGECPACILRKNGLEKYLAERK